MISYHIIALVFWRVAGASLDRPETDVSPPYGFAWDAKHRKHGKRYSISTTCPNRVASGITPYGT